MSIYDSDYDENDEIQRSEMEEMFSISQHSEDFEKDQSEFESEIEDGGDSAQSFLGHINSKNSFVLENYKHISGEENHSMLNSRINNNQQDHLIEIYNQCKS
jgi:hypothetical protein